MKTKILLAITLITLIAPISPTLAADATPSADIQEKLKALQEEIASKAAQFKLEISQKLQNKAYIGNIKTKSDGTLSLSIKTGDATVNTNQFTEVIGKGKVTLKTLAANDYIAALGDVDENGVLTAKRIIKLAPPVADNRKTFFGQITWVGDESIKVFTKDEQILTVNLVDDTVLTRGKSPATLKNLTVNQDLIISGNVLKSGVIEASFVYVLPYGNVLRPKGVATPAPASSQAIPK